MSRISKALIDIDHPLYNVVEKAKEKMGFLSHDVMSMAHNVPISQAFFQFTDVILNDGNVSPELKRLIGVIVSTSSGCNYCKAHASFNAYKRGSSEDRITRVWDYKKEDIYEHKEKAALDLALYSSTSPHRVPDEVFDRLNVFYSESEIVELLSTIGLYTFLNRYNQALDTELEYVPAGFQEKLKS